MMTTLQHLEQYTPGSMCWHRKVVSIITRLFIHILGAGRKENENEISMVKMFPAMVSMTDGLLRVTRLTNLYRLVWDGAIVSIH